MTASGEDVKPDTSKVRITVEFNEQRLSFLYKKNKPVEKLLILFCEKMNLDRRTIRFNCNGRNAEQEGTTAESLQMEDDDVIEGHIFQQGG
ncbi:hypothetical protein B0H17DRAFT_1063635 [Mycena rosella]|uniref:Rad60/SUMO-like domain-containing protein n=1 Tax=Mycena rosella TaxID=1033263 RepID=A0AAD7DGG9_MYCRO|nr:hypothetical protein B0H17DRAFT_1063635 [Mycena rosella]